MSNDVMLNDDEKVEQIKKWWKKYGNLATTIVLVVVLVITGLQFWNRHKLKETEQASIAYENVLASEQAAPQITDNLAEEMKQKYSGTAYADFAAFILAKNAISRNDYVAAAGQLQWAVDHAASDNLEQLARLRLARVLLAQQKPQKALDVLQSKKITIYPGLAAVVAGDAYKALGNVDQARQSYQTAIQELPKKTAFWTLVNMKLNDLPASK
jgi:predicted negative regulator of RcsB-dependent stress response